MCARRLLAGRSKHYSSLAAQPVSREIGGPPSLHRMGVANDSASVLVEVAHSKVFTARVRCSGGAVDAGCGGLERAARVRDR